MEYDKYHNLWIYFGPLVFCTSTLEKWIENPALRQLQSIHAYSAQCSMPYSYLVVDYDESSAGGWPSCICQFATETRHGRIHFQSTDPRKLILVRKNHGLISRILDLPLPQTQRRHNFQCASMFFNPMASIFSALNAFWIYYESIHRDQLNRRYKRLATHTRPKTWYTKDHIFGCSKMLREQRKRVYPFDSLVVSIVLTPVHNPASERNWYENLDIVLAVYVGSSIFEGYHS